MSVHREHVTQSYHFNLGFVGSVHPEAYVKTPLGKFPLRAHDASSRAAARLSNRAVAAMPEDKLDRLTHFADVQIPLDAPFLMRLHTPQGEGTSLPELYGVKVAIPPAALREVRSTDLEMLTRHAPAHLAVFGIAMPQREALSDLQWLDFMADADLVSDLPTDTACGIAFSHPNMCSTDSNHASIILDRYIARSKYASQFASEIAQLGIASEGRNGFALIQPSTLPGTSQAPTWNEGYAQFGKDPSSSIYIYSLNPAFTGTPTLPGSPGTPPTQQAGARMICSSLGGVTNDLRLKDSHWSVNQAHQTQSFDPGVTNKGLVDNKRLVRKPLSAAVAEATDAGGYEFTINNKTPGHGLSIYSDSIAFDTSTNRFSIDVKNTYMRTLGMHVRFYDSQNQPLTGGLGDYPELEKLFEAIKDVFGMDDTQKFLGFLYSVYAIMDIPMPSNPKTLEFPWPSNAESCDILFGNIGFSRWNTTSDLLGAIATAIFQFGVPIIFFVGGAAVKKSTWYVSIMKDKAFLAALIVIALFLYPAILVGAYALGLGRTVINTTANFIASMIVGQVAGLIADKVGKAVVKTLVEDVLLAGLKPLSEFVFVKLAVSEAIDAIPFAGWAMEALNIATTLGALGESAGEIIASPATYTVQVTRKLQVSATVAPDPLHGSLGNPPIWPTEATHYKAVLQYKNGTAYTVTGALPVEQADRATPVTVLFDSIPSGGQFQISFGVYSNTDWLAGNWTSAWVDALIPSGGSALTISGAIIENLVPLTTSTQYLYQSKIVYSSGAGHQWQTGNQPTQTLSNLSSSGLNELVSISSNNAAYMLGYTWQAANQNIPFVGSTTPSDGQMYVFQNINSLSDPEASLKFPSAGFSSATFLAYEQFGPEPLFSVPSAQSSAVISDLDAGVLDAALLDTFQTAGYPIPSDATVQIVQQTVEWTITLPGQPQASYQLNRESDQSIAVFLYPTNVVGQNNFYIDSATSVRQLRKVILDNSTPFDMQSSQSYGCFTLQTLDAVVIHPANYAVGVSYDDHYLEIVPILQSSVSDADAEPGTLLSGPGIRQGLMLGPKAVAVSQDGRILVLEAINKRIQAFDINGNPVPCFDGGQVIQLPASQYESDLNAGLVSLDLRNALASADVELAQHWRINDGLDVYDISLAGTQYQIALNGAPLANTWVITDSDGTTYNAVLNADAISVTVPDVGTIAVPLSACTDMDMGIVDAAVIAAFYEQASIALSPQATVQGNGLFVDPAVTESDLCQGNIPDSVVQALATVYITLTPAATVQSVVLNNVQARDTAWLIVDPEHSTTYSLMIDANDPTQINVMHMVPFMQLRTADGSSASNALADYHGNDLADLMAAASRSDEKYLDMTTEMKGYIYVLAYTGTGASQSDYYLDIYDPLGHWLSRTPDPALNDDATGVNAARIAVDMWRNMFSLNFESFAGPGGRIEPSISMWVPTTPSA